jgi:hypothetical protein
MPRWFEKRELDVMDCLTANNPVVLASFGGPAPGDGGMEKGFEGLERQYEEEHQGIERQRVGSIHR